MIGESAICDAISSLGSTLALVSATLIAMAIAGAFGDLSAKVKKICPKRDKKKKKRTSR